MSLIIWPERAVRHLDRRYPVRTLAAVHHERSATINVPQERTPPHRRHRCARTHLTPAGTTPATPRAPSAAKAPRRSRSRREHSPRPPTPACWRRRAAPALPVMSRRITAAPAAAVAYSPDAGRSQRENTAAPASQVPTDAEPSGPLIGSGVDGRADVQRDAERTDEEAVDRQPQPGTLRRRRADSTAHRTLPAGPRSAATAARGGGASLIVGTAWARRRRRRLRPRQQRRAQQLGGLQRHQPLVGRGGALVDDQLAQQRPAGRLVRDPYLHALARRDHADCGGGLVGAARRRRATRSPRRCARARRRRPPVPARTPPPVIRSANGSSLAR